MAELKWRASKCLGARVEQIEVSERLLVLDTNSESHSTHRFDLLGEVL